MRLHEIAELQEKIYQETQDYSKSIYFTKKDDSFFRYFFGEEGKVVRYPRSDKAGGARTILMYLSDLTDDDWEIIEGSIYDKTNN